MRIRSFVALVCSATLLTLALSAGFGSPANAGTTSVEVEAQCSFAPAVPDPIPRPFQVTIETPDHVPAGSTFDATFLVELDLGVMPPGVDLSEFRVHSRWRISGASSPVGDVELVSPTRSYQSGDTVVYDPIVVPVSAPATPGATIGIELLDITYQLRWAGTVSFIGPDCELPAAPVAVVELTVGASDLTCLGRPVTIAGTHQDDVLVGTSGRDVIHGVGGNNVIYGLGGDDIICGGPGNDVIFGGSGNDRIDGGGGVTVIFGGTGRDTCTNGFAFGC